MNNIKKNIFSWKSIIGLAISFVCIGILYYQINIIQDGDITLDKIFSKIKKINILYFSCSIFCLYITNYVRAIRWKYIFPKNNLIKISYLYKSEIIGFWGNSVLPLRLGELLKIKYAKKKKENQKI